MSAVANTSLSALAWKTVINQKPEFTSSLVSSMSSNPSGPRAAVPTLPHSGTHHGLFPCCHPPPPSGPGCPQLRPCPVGVRGAAAGTGQGEQPHLEPVWRPDTLAQGSSNQPTHPPHPLPLNRDRTPDKHGTTSLGA